MANFALVENDLVIQVIVIANDDCDNLPFPESEPVGQAFIESLGIAGTWLQTSYNNNFRGIFAGIGFSYDPAIGEYGEFIAPPYVEPVT